MEWFGFVSNRRMIRSKLEWNRFTLLWQKTAFSTSFYESYLAAFWSILECPYICNDIRYFDTNIWTSFETTLWSAFEKVSFQSKLLLNNIVNVISRRYFTTFLDVILYRYFKRHIGTSLSTSLYNQRRRLLRRQEMWVNILTDRRPNV